MKSAFRADADSSDAGSLAVLCRAVRRGARSSIDMRRPKARGMAGTGAP